MSTDESEKVECPYCGKEFDDKIEEGVHRSEEHVNGEDEIPRVARGSMGKDNIVSDWSGEDE